MIVANLASSNPPRADISTEQPISLNAHSSPRLKWFTIAIIVFLSLASVFLKARGVFTEKRAFSGDESVYVSLSTGLLEGKGFQRDGKPTAWRTPGFPAYLTVIRYFTGEDEDNIFVSRILVFLLNCSITPLIGWLTWLLFKDNLIAIAACLFWAVLFNSRALASELMAEEPSSACLLAGFIIGLCAVPRQSLVLALFSGLSIGAAILMRGYLLPVTFTLPLFYLIHRRDIFSTKLALACVTTTALVLFGWSFRNLLMMNSFTFSTEGSEQIWIGCNAWTRGSWDGWSNSRLVDQTYPQSQYLTSKYPTILTMSEVELASVFAREAVNEISTSPGRALWLLPRKAVIYFLPYSYLGTDFTYLCLIPLALVGSFLLLWPLGRRDLFVLLTSPILSVLLICLLTFGDPRFRHPIDPFIAILASLGLVGLARHFREAYFAENLFP